MERLSFVDTAKFIGIYLMIMSHSALGHHPLNQYIFAFHMPLFFIIYGFVYKYKDMTFLDFLKKNTKRILVPYVLFATIFSSGINIKTLLCIGYGSWRSLGILHVSPFWFLPSYFAMTVIVYTINKVAKPFRGG